MGDREYKKEDILYTREIINNMWISFTNFNKTKFNMHAKYVFVD